MKPSNKFPSLRTKAKQSKFGLTLLQSGLIACAKQISAKIPVTMTYILRVCEENV